MNTHGGNLSEAYIIGMTHIREAVEQLRGTAVNQVDGAEIALVTGGPACCRSAARCCGGRDTMTTTSRSASSARVCSRRS